MCTAWRRCCQGLWLENKNEKKIFPRDRPHALFWESARWVHIKLDGDCTAVGRVKASVCHVSQAGPIGSAFTSFRASVECTWSPQAGRNVSSYSQRRLADSRRVLGAWARYKRGEPDFQRHLLPFPKLGCQFITDLDKFSFPSTYTGMNP
jgi:hypothetical protein